MKFYLSIGNWFSFDVVHNIVPCRITSDGSMHYDWAVREHVFVGRMQTVS